MGNLFNREGREFESSQEYEYLEYSFHSMTVLPAPVGYRAHLPSLRVTIPGSKGNGSNKGQKAGATDRKEASAAEL